MQTSCTLSKRLLPILNHVLPDVNLEHKNWKRQDAEVKLGLVPELHCNDVQEVPRLLRVRKQRRKYPACSIMANSFTHIMPKMETDLDPTEDLVILLEADPETGLVEI